MLPEAAPGLVEAKESVDIPVVEEITEERKAETEPAERRLRMKRARMRRKCEFENINYYL